MSRERASLIGGGGEGLPSNQDQTPKANAFGKGRGGTGTSSFAQVFKGEVQETIGSLSSKEGTRRAGKFRGSEKNF